LEFGERMIKGLEFGRDDGVSHVSLVVGGMNDLRQGDGSVIVPSFLGLCALNYQLSLGRTSHRVVLHSLQ
jgi:hypothetical protein